MFPSLIFKLGGPSPKRGQLIQAAVVRPRFLFPSEEPRNLSFPAPGAKHHGSVFFDRFSTCLPLTPREGRSRCCHNQCTFRPHFVLRVLVVRVLVFPKPCFVVRGAGSLWGQEAGSRPRSYSLGQLVCFGRSGEKTQGDRCVLCFATATGTRPALEMETHTGQKSCVSRQTY